jgi:hypothetical protein
MSEEAVRMVPQASSEEMRVRAVMDALTPYAWRRLTPEMISRRALAAIDGHAGTDALPVPRHDERIEVLLEFLGRCRWPSLTARALSHRLVTTLDTWRQESQWLEVELRWLLEAGD